MKPTAPPRCRVLVRLQGTRHSSGRILPATSPEVVVDKPVSGSGNPRASEFKMEEENAEQVHQQAFLCSQKIVPHQNFNEFMATKGQSPVHPTVGEQTRGEHMSHSSDTSENQNLIEAMAREEARLLRRRAYQRAYQYQRREYQRAYQRQRRERLKAAGVKGLHLCSNKVTSSTHPNGELTMDGDISLSTEASQNQNLIESAPREGTSSMHPTSNVTKDEGISLSTKTSQHQNLIEAMSREANPSSAEPFVDAPLLIREGILSAMEHALEVLESTAFESFGKRMNFFQAHLAWFKRYSVPVSDFEDRLNQLSSMYSKSCSRQEEINKRLLAIAQTKTELEREEGALRVELNALSSRFSDSSESTDELKRLQTSK